MANVFDLIEVDTEKDVLRVKQATKDGYLECCPDGCFDGSYAISTKRRGRVQGGGQIAPALTCGAENTLYVFEIETNINK